MAADVRRFVFLGNWDSTANFTMSARRIVLLMSWGFLVFKPAFWILVPPGADAFSPLSIGASPFSVVPEGSPAFSEDAAPSSAWGEVSKPTTSWS